MARTKIPLATRFWNKVNKHGPTMRPEIGPCWAWTGGPDSNGYGFIRIQGKFFRSHRLSWEMTNGPIPDGLKVLHRCDNPPCVRPDHLFLGTSKDNAIDRDTKERRAGVLGLDDVRTIRNRYANGAAIKDLAHDFSRTHKHIRSIISGRYWKFVDAGTTTD